MSSRNVQIYVVRTALAHIDGLCISEMVHTPMNADVDFVYSVLQIVAGILVSRRDFADTAEGLENAQRYADESLPHVACPYHNEVP